MERERWLREKLVDMTRTDRGEGGGKKSGGESVMEWGGEGKGMGDDAPFLVSKKTEGAIELAYPKREEGEEEGD